MHRGAERPLPSQNLSKSWRAAALFALVLAAGGGTCFIVRLAVRDSAIIPQYGKHLSAGGSFSDKLISGGFGPEMSLVDAGSFRAGTVSALWREAERPPYTVTILHPFAVARTEITVAQFRSFVSSTSYTIEDGCWHHDADEVWRFDPHRNWQSPGFAQGETHPVTCISWYDARAYIDWLSRETHETYRLPSETEFELLLESGQNKTTDMASEICSAANGADLASPFHYRNESCSDGSRYTAPVASFRANSLGLYDTHGNVWEWTEDCWTEGINRLWYLLTAAPVDGSAWLPKTCKYRSTRGGAWLSSVDNLAASARRPSPPGFRLTSIGFRPVREFRTQGH